MMAICLLCRAEYSGSKWLHLAQCEKYPRQAEARRRAMQESQGEVWDEAMSDSPSREVTVDSLPGSDVTIVDSSRHQADPVPLLHEKDRVCPCGRPHHALGLCRLHYQRRYMREYRARVKEQEK